MTVTGTPLPGVLVFALPRFSDERGWFSELWNARRYRDAGLDVTFLQENVSCSSRGVLRGMHFQHPSPQGKLVTALVGSIYDVVVDVRPDSPTFGRWYGHELTAAAPAQLWVPPGLAHGFLALSDEAVVHYSCTAAYDPAADRSIAWDDPDIGITWPLQPALVSAKDRAAPRLRDVPHDALPTTGTMPRSHT